MITEEVKNKLKENNAIITRLLKENEVLIANAGYTPPYNDFAVDRPHRIGLPSNYVRVNEIFIANYHLNDIVREQSVRKNIAYSLQVSDLYNYLFNRFYIWGSVETMLYKQAIIGLVSVLEALIFECANNICCCPNECGMTRVCEKHFSKQQRNNSFEALKRMKELSIVDFDDHEIDRIKSIIELRNRVHIRLATDNEFTSADFSLTLYNEVILLLQRLSDGIYTNGISMYGNCT